MDFKYCLVFVTAKDMEEAGKIQQELVESRLAACVKIIDKVGSLFSWKNNIEKESETLLIIETKASLVDKAIKKIKSLHSYETPAISAVPILKGNEGYLKWIDEVTEKG